MTISSQCSFGPEVLLVFVGHSDDADQDAEVVLEVEHDLQRLLEQHLEVSNGTLPFKTVRLWEWNRDASAGIGGQEKIIAPIIERANAAVFLFKERIGTVTWGELEHCRSRDELNSSVLAFFAESPPTLDRMKDVTAVANWLELLEKKRTLTADWATADSRSVTPMDDYRDAIHLRELVGDKMKQVIARLLRPQLPSLSPSCLDGRFLAEHPHLNYDRRPVLIHTPDELDQELLRRFLDKPLSQDQLGGQQRSRSSRTTIAEQLRLLGLQSEGRPTLGAFLCFAPQVLLANKFDCCSMQLVAYSGTERGTSRANITAARGNLLELFDASMTWLTTRAGLERRGSIGREDRDQLEIPEIVLREVLANALVHRDYELLEHRDQPTRIEVYSDRVEVTSFGALPPAVPVESLNSNPERVVPYRRNPIIARIFQAMSHVELNASGVPRMRKEMERASLPPPRFIHDLHESVVRVVMLRPSQWAQSEQVGHSPANPTHRRLQVFISSTFKDLWEHRRSVEEACLRLGLLPILVESQSVAANDKHRTFPLVDQADVYIGIFGYRYGHVATGEDHSHVELEYRRAKKRGIPCLIFMMHDDHPIRESDVEVGPAAYKLTQLKQEIRQESLVHFFRSPEDLKEQVALALAPVCNDVVSRPPIEFPEKRPTHTEDLPIPPDQYVVHPYFLDTVLAGRKIERGELDAWIGRATDDLERIRVYCIVGIGGVGKSSLAWKWLQDVNTEPMHRLAGQFWWSFYEDPAFDRFVVHALAYVTESSIEKTDRIPRPERERQLLAVLNAKPFLLVLDGLERIFNAYGSESTDSELMVGDSPLRRAADLDAGEFLRKLTRVTEGRILITTRLFPADLETPIGDPIPGSVVHSLSGLDADGVFELWHSMGMHASADALSRLGEHFDNHPLTLRIVAGLVSRHRRAPGDLDRFLQDRPDLQWEELLPLGLKPRILHAAFNGLDDVQRLVLRTIAGLDRVTFGRLSKLLVGEDKSLPDEKDLGSILTELEDRGLIGWDRVANSYSIHPIVRAFALSQNN